MPFFYKAHKGPRAEGCSRPQRKQRFLRSQPGCGPSLMLCRQVLPAALLTRTCLMNTSSRAWQVWVDSWPHTGPVFWVSRIRWTLPRSLRTASAYAASKSPGVTAAESQLCMQEAVKQQQQSARCGSAKWQGQATPMLRTNACAIGFALADTSVWPPGCCPCGAVCCWVMLPVYVGSGHYDSRHNHHHGSHGTTTTHSP